jgi:hypothetical protein
MGLKTKNIEQLQSETVVKRFARRHNLGLDDPICRTLLQRLKMGLGYERCRNQVKAEDRRRQPGLFDS